MSSISLQFSTQDGALQLSGSHQTTQPTINLLGTLLQPSEAPPGTILAPIQVGPTDPTQPTFSHLNLPRLTSQPTLNLTTSVAGLLVNLLDSTGSTNISQYVSGFSISFPLNGIIEGTLQLYGLPQDFSLTEGQLLSISQCYSGGFGPTPLTLDSTEYTWDNIALTLDATSIDTSKPPVCLKVANLYITSNPILTTDENGVHSMTLQIGDELALFNEKARLRTRLYCGPLPRTAQEAARIYAEYNGLFTRTFPAGHQLLDRDDQSFSTESPFQYLQALYAPTNQDVRCNPQGGIIAIPRPTFQPDSALSINFQNTLEVDSSVSSNYRSTNKLRLANQYSVLSSLSPRIEVSKTVSSLPTNTKPWFQSGYTETTTTSHYIGDTLIFQKRLFQGYKPTAASLPLSNEAYTDDPCASTIPTEWATIETYTYSLNYYPHPSGAFLSSKAQTWLNGLRPRQQPDTTWVLYNGPLEYTIETYENTPQINIEVCSKDYIHLETATRKEVYKLDSNFVYRLTQVSDIRYSPLTSNPQAGTSFEGFTQEWRKVESEGAYSEADKSFIIQPALETNEEPPGSKWVRPSLRNAIVFTLLEDPKVQPVGALPVAIEAPFCYNLQQLTVYGNRWLQENNGLAQGIELVVPYHSPIRLGQSIWYTDSLGTTSGYLVFDITLTQEGPNAYKTVLLAKAT